MLLPSSATCNDGLGAACAGATLLHVMGASSSATGINLTPSLSLQVKTEESHFHGWHSVPFATQPYFSIQDLSTSLHGPGESEVLNLTST